MKQVIYVDVLICVNLFINYFLLLSTVKFLNLKFKYIRILIGAFIGAAYSLIIFVPNVNSILSIILKLIVSIIIVFVSFGIMEIKLIIKAVSCFYLINFGFCGVMLALWYLFSPLGLMMNNGIVYFNISPVVFLVSTLFSYVLIRLLNKITGYSAPKKLFYYINISNNNKVCCIKAKIDTGNTLKEPFSSIPVIVAEYKYIKNIVPNEFKDTMLIEDNNEFDIKDLNNFRLIPFKTVSGNGILPAFKPDKIVIRGGKEINKEAYVAVCKSGTLSKEYMGLINPELVEI